MTFNTEDKKAYISYLNSEIEKTAAQKETIYNLHYINNLYNDLTDMKKNLTKK